MNERIKELITECETTYVDWLGRKHVEFDKEKFAELIVRECIGCCDIVGRIEWIEPPTYELAIKASKQKIKQHFGVEE